VDLAQSGLDFKIILPSPQNDPALAMNERFYRRVVSNTLLL